MSGALLPLDSRAAIVDLQGTVTNLQSTADRMISYRHQNRMWRTADGALHLVANVGVQGGGGSLRLFTSADNGVSWGETAALPDTDDASTADGFVVNDNLFLAYSTSAQAIKVSFFSYQSASGTWQQGAIEVAHSSPEIAVASPAMARDGEGRYWLAFTARDSQGNNMIRMVHRASAAEGWVDTGFVFGDVDSATIERSGRPVAVSDGMGIVYTVKQDVYWAKRSNGWALDQPWARSLVYRNLAPDTDPYGSHFSVLVDASSNVHVATMDGGRLIYFRLSHADQVWARKILTGPRNVAYMKLARSSGDQLVLAYNDKTNLRVFQSSDAGLSWTLTNRLVHPRPGSGTDYSNPRVETLANVAGSPVAVLQQFVDAGAQRLMQFEVPVVPVP